ncbi:hypothetical protein TNCV_2494931 [Trichonephila clavipes]|nr:hypothetical protein TNCV_2494931 [Trichonephila clavipes]
MGEESVAVKEDCSRSFFKYQGAQPADDRLLFFVIEDLASKRSSEANKVLMKAGVPLIYYVTAKYHFSMERVARGQGRELVTGVVEQWVRILVPPEDPPRRGNHARLISLGTSSDVVLVT